MNEDDRRRILDEIANYAERYEPPQAGDISAKDIMEADGCGYHAARRIMKKMVDSGRYVETTVHSDRWSYRVVRAVKKA